MEDGAVDVLRTNPPAIMRVEEAARYLCVSVKTVRREVESRRLRPARIGRRLIFTRAELDRFVALCASMN